MNNSQKAYPVLIIITSMPYFLYFANVYFRLIVLQNEQRN